MPNNVCAFIAVLVLLYLYAAASDHEYAVAVASTIATRNDAELRELFSSSTDIDLSFFSNSTASQFLAHFWSHGTLQVRSCLAHLGALISAVQ